LKGQRSFRAAPYYGGAPFTSVSEAISVLKESTGQDFGDDAQKWGEWLRLNRRAYSRKSSAAKSKD
jgi:hypothetical protein